MHWLATYSSTPRSCLCQCATHTEKKHSSRERGNTSGQFEIEHAAQAACSRVRAQFQAVGCCYLLDCGLLLGVCCTWA